MVERERQLHDGALGRSVRAQQCRVANAGRQRHVEAVVEPGDSPVFSSGALQAARTARRLRDDFELNPDGLALAMRLLERVEELERELERLRAGMTGPQHSEVA